jgi:hypothetical protein
MKTILIILIVLVPSFASDGLKQRLKRVQQSQEQILQQEDVKAPPAPVYMAPMQETEESVTPFHGDRITRLEVSQKYMEKDLDKAIKTLEEMREIQIEIVATLEKASKVTEVQTNNSARADTIINIIMAVVGFFITGGGGYFAWKNKHVVFRPKDKGMGDTQAVDTKA